MKNFRYIVILMLILLGVNVYADPLAIKNGDAVIPNGGTFAMPAVNKVGDPASVATLTIVRDEMKSLTLKQSGCEEIVAAISGADLTLNFIPVDSAGQYSKTLTISGLDLDDNPQSISITVTAICEWGKLRFCAFPYDVVPGEKSSYHITVDQTSFYGFRNDVTINTMIIPAITIPGVEPTTITVDGRNVANVCEASTKTYLAALMSAQKTQEYGFPVTVTVEDVEAIVGDFCITVDMNDRRNRAYCLIDNNTINLAQEAPDVPSTFGMLCLRLTFENENGDVFTAYQWADPGVDLNINTADNEAVPGFDLTSCFNVFGDPVFDSLYLMSNSYCGIYVPNEWGDGYELAASYNPSEQKRILSNPNGKKLYFTGRCDYAYTGDANAMNEDRIGIQDYYSLDGAFNLMGGGGNKTDIFLENFHIQTISRAGGDCNNGLHFVYRDVPGGSIVFAIISSAQGTDSNGNKIYYDVNFHSKGTNKLISNPGVNFYLDFVTFATVHSDGFTFGSAPIAIRESVSLPLSDMLKEEKIITRTASRLNFDDYWVDGTACNGLLELNNNGQENVGSIDLGNELTQCNFYGGRYKLSSGATRRNSVVHLVPDPSKPNLADNAMDLDYFMSNSMAICYRTFQISLTVRGVATIDVAMYGFGNDVVGYGQVNFWGGTFETYGVSDAYMSESNQLYEYCYYRNKYDLRIPDGSQVNGGSFTNCDVFLCDTVSSRGVNPINIFGDTVCRMPIAINNVNADGTAQFTIPSQFEYDIEGKGQFSLNDYYGNDALINTMNSKASHAVINANAKHGMVADASNNVYVYMPCDMDESLNAYVPIKTKVWWNTVMPKYSANPSGGANISSDGSLYNCYFIDVVLDSIVYRKGQIININFESFRGVLQNKGNAEIQNRLYLVMPVYSNQWLNFMAPFDISNVYEVSTAQVPAAPITAKSWNTYKTNLGQNNYDLIVGFAPQLIFGAHMDLLELVQYVGDSLLTRKGKNFEIIPRIPYLGNNASEAHFYLYTPTTEQWKIQPNDTIVKSLIQYSNDYIAAHGYLTTDEQYETLADTYLELSNQSDALLAKWRRGEELTDDERLLFKIEKGVRFDEDWTYVTPVNKHFEDENGDHAIDADVIMEAKKVYGINFPGEQRYPYWNNRYLIFEGYGKQTVYGSNEHANFVKSASVGRGKWGGNYTFVPYEAPDNIYLLDSRTSYTSYLPASVIHDTVFPNVADDRFQNEKKIAEGVVSIEKVRLNEWGYEETSLVPGIAPHAAYMVVNKKVSAPNRYTGMTNSDEVSATAPTISDVSFVVYDYDGLNIETNYDQVMTIFNMQGQTVFSHFMAAGEKVILNVPAGVYVVSGESDNVKLTIK